MQHIPQEALDKYKKKTASDVLHAARLGSSGLPLPASYLPGPVGLRKISGEQKTSAYESARGATGMSTAAYPVSLGKGRRRKTMKGKKRTHKRKTRARK